MEAERWQVVQRIFHGLLDLPEEQRAGFLADATAGDAELKREVETLLEAHLQDPDFLDQPIVELSSLDLPGDVTGDGPTRIGPYEVIRPLGEGGMGQVYLALQQTPAFTRPVAIKIVKRGMDTDEVLRRFGLERRILAELVHPNIAQLYDAGATEDGRPYFVMEFVEGERIDRYTEEKAVSLEERLRLFRLVCDAVQHAHQKLILHRDIKPGNVLVNADGVPKLVDFGIGKVLSDSGEVADSLTRTHARRLTPEYAAPEQLRGEPASTSADVYGLGALLYELITGVRPWSDEGARTRRDSGGAPRRPSEAVGSGDPGATQRWARRLRGDLDNIVLKAMHPEADRRYGSVAAFAEDIDRHVTGRPVRARPDSFAYRSSKFVRRNRWSVATAAAVVVGLVGVSVTTTVQSRRVARERDKAEEVQSFLLEAFGATTADGAAGDSVTVRQLLDGQVEVVRTAYEDDAELRAEMLTVLADAYERLGLYENAEELAREGLDERRALPDAEPADVAFSLNLLGWIRHQRGAPDEAVELLTESVELWRTLGEDARAGLARALNDIGSVYDQLGRTDEGEAALREALVIRRETAGPLDRRVAVTSNNLATLMYRRGDYLAADSLGQAALDALRATVGADHQRTIIAQSNLATYRWVAGDLDGAEEVYRDLLDRLTGVDGGRNPRTASVMVTYASLLRAQGDRAAAETLLVDALEIQEEALGPTHPAIGNTARILGIVLQRSDRVDEAVPMLERALAINRAAYGDEHRLVAEATLSVALVHDLAGIPGALDEFREAVRVFDATLGPAHPRTVDTRTRWGAALLDAGRTTDALDAFEVAHREALARTPPDPATIQGTRLWLVEAYRAAGDGARADSLFAVAEQEAGSDAPPAIASRIERLRRGEGSPDR